MDINIPVSLVNTLMRCSFRPLLQYSGSISISRRIVKLIDSIFALQSVSSMKTDVSGHRCSLEWLQAKTYKEGAPVILYLPGGAYLVRLPNTHRALVNRLTTAANAKALLTFYSLAPENPFPAGLNDAIDAYEYMLAEGIKPEKIVIAGDSAGGGLAVATMLAIRDRKLPLPAGLIVMSPLADFTHSGESRTTNCNKDPVLVNSRRIDQNELYLNGTSAENPLVSPVFADLSGFPPMLAFVSDNEILLDDTLRLVENAKQAAVSVELEVGKNLPHVWPIVAQMKASRAAIAKMTSFIHDVTNQQP